MKTIKNSIKRIEQEPGIEGMYKMIRDCAAVCYQTDVEKMKLSPKDFVHNVLIKKTHGRPLEFGTVYMHIKGECKNDDKILQLFRRYSANKWSKVEYDIDELNGILDLYITTNFRVIMQGYYSEDIEAAKNNYDGNWVEDVEKYWCEPTDKHEKRYCYCMILSRGAADDFRTHIGLSSVCESTRFCNYANDKFGNELTFIEPYWEDNKQYILIKSDFEHCDKIYKMGRELNMQPQQLKRMLPLGIKCELIMCGYKENWDNFFWRRCSPNADPECRIVANMIKENFQKINASTKE